MAGGLSNDKLEELRKQREQERAKKRAEEEQVRKAELERLEKEKAQQALLAEKEKAERENALKAEQERKEQERKAELERIEKEKAELKAQHEKEKAELKDQLEKEKQEKIENQQRHSEELAKEKEKQIEMLKEQKNQVEKDKEKAVQEKNEEINQLKQDKKSAEEKLEVAKKRKAETINNYVYTSKVQVVNDEPVMISKDGVEAEEDNKVQVGFTMVDKSLVKEAKDNKRYGIKERSPLFKKLNNIVFYMAIPFMLVWALLAFSGICTSKVGHTSFANLIYYKVAEDIAVDEGYKTGSVRVVKEVDLSDIKEGDIICVEYRRADGVKDLQFHRVTTTYTDATTGDPIILFEIDRMNDTLSEISKIELGKEIQYTRDHNISIKGIDAGKDLFIGSFLMIAQNIVGFTFIVLVPAAIILTFQFINLYDTIRFYVKQRKIANSNKRRVKVEDNRDKIKR